MTYNRTRAMNKLKDYLKELIKNENNTEKLIMDIYKLYDPKRMDFRILNKIAKEVLNIENEEELSNKLAKVLTNS